jgi:hypothetical protein
MCVVFTIILLAGGDAAVDSDTLLVIDFVNLNIKPAQSFGYAHRDRIYVHVFIEMSAHTYTSIYVCTVFLKKLMFLSEIVLLSAYA